MAEIHLKKAILYDDPTSLYESWASECIASVLRFLRFLEQRFGWETHWPHHRILSIDVYWESRTIIIVINLATFHNSQILHPIKCATIFVSLRSSDTLRLFGIRCIYLSCDVPWCSKHLSKTSLSLQAGPFSSSFQRNEYHNAKLHTQTTISNFHQAIQLKCPNTLPGTTPLSHVHLKPFPAPRCQNQLRGAKSPSAPKGKGQAATRHQSYHALVLPKRLMRPANDLDCQHMSRSMDTNTIYMAIYGCYPGGGCALTITGRPSSDSRIAWAKVASQISTCAFDAGRRISGLESRQVGQ